MTHVNRREPESLIERAAKVYDFGAHLRRREPVPVEGETVPASDRRPSEGWNPSLSRVAQAPDMDPSLRWGDDKVAEPAPLDLAVPWLGDAPPAPDGAEVLSPEAALTLAAIPPELRAGGAADEDTYELLPTGIAHIDRGMLAEKGMLVPGAPIGALAEEFRLVKRQLLLNARAIAASAAPDKARMILVGSGKPGDGKTFCAINLAISLAAERDTEVLLVDADFAKPDVMNTLGLDDSTGFLDMLGDPTIDPESCIVATDVPQLSLLPAGKRTHADTELLASARTHRVIERLLAADPRRIIVFDTPPALAASPASVLALLVGQVMLVVRADRTTEADVREAVSLLDGCDRISLVLNSVSYQPGGGRFGSYYGQEK